MTSVQENETFSTTEFEFNDPAQRLVLAIMFIIVSVVGSLGNAIVIAAVIASRKLRTITNVFVVNLAVADFLTSITVPWTAVALLSEGDTWPLDPWICTAAAAIMYLCVGTSLYSLASASINRFILVTKGYATYRKTFTTINLIIWITLIWVVAFFFAIFLPVIGVGRLGYNRKYRSCSQSSDHPKDGVYQLVQAVGIFPIPLTIISFCYGRIFCFVRRHIKVMDGHTSAMDTRKGYHGNPSNTTSDTVREPKDRQTERAMPVREASSTVGVTIDQDQARRPTTRTCKPVKMSKDQRTESRMSFAGRPKSQAPSMKQRQIQITTNMFIVVCVFVVCLAPFTICLFYNDSDPFIPYASAIVLCNSCVNPFIYATKHPVFKSVMKSIVTCHFPEIPQPARLMHRFTTNRTSIIELE
ncbi:G-protein coupled receptor moody-like [Diadema antillarum]|uniref:G-protein coupled receptor moody-like n=1 Tax=Diadema antillarum TaxID=105358 RepID=UPI003A8459E5